ncbi:MAG: hypothetical protein D3921_04045 [Candidatus Electrothrix sp. AW1]|nr:hypothetical protein [Candidatus Electrothrix sp. AX1]MCI5181683.1 hypothetical protein [Candidatus Electrothrix gigas]
MKRIIFFLLFTALLASVGSAAPGDKIFYEDFSSYGEGELPAGWIGGDNMSVMEVNRKKILRYFANGSYDVTTKKIDLLGNFKVTILMKHYFHNNSQKNFDIYNDILNLDIYNVEKRNNGFIVVHFGAYQISIGDGEIRVGIKDKWSDLKELETVAPEQTFSLSLERRGTVCKVYVNNAKVFVGRYPDVKMNNIRFSSNSKFEIHSIVVEEL